MRILLFVNGLSYVYTPPDNGRIYHFQRNVPKEVPDEVADSLMKTGKFMELPYKGFNALEGYQLSVKYCGTIGDAVAISNCVAAVEREKGWRICGLVNEVYSALCKKICPRVDFKSWFAYGRAPRHVNMETAIRTGGEGFAWEKGIAYALGMTSYPPPPQAILFTDEAPAIQKVLLPNRHTTKLAVLHMWSVHSRSKSYDPAKVGTLIRGLQASGFDVAIIGGRDEPKYEADYIDLRGKYSIVQSAYTLSIADVVITIDSWAWHMAKLFHKPQVVLFGSLRCDGTPCPWENIIMLRGRLCDGRNCSTYSCRNSQCIDTIEVDKILSSVATVLARSQSQQLHEAKVLAC